MDLPVPLSLRPMEAMATASLPDGEAWAFEPKYDGFRCLAFRCDGKCALMSKNGKRLERYFPEVSAALLDLPASRFVLDGEIRLVTPDFATQQLRLHPAEKRVGELARRHPAELIAFDVLVAPGGAEMLRAPFSERSAVLRTEAVGGAMAGLTLADSLVGRPDPASIIGRPGVDGIMAKRLALPYRPGKRAMRKYKAWRTVDCVVGGVHVAGRSVEALLLGLYDDEGRLSYVGRAPIARDGPSIYELIEPIMGGRSFTGRRPERRDRWTGKDRTPVDIRPIVVAEVATDLIAGGVMRHGARLLRIRQDKASEDCTFEQIQPTSGHQVPGSLGAAGPA